MPSLAATVGIAFTIILAICYAKSSPVDRGPDKKYNYSGQQHDSKRSEKASLDALQDGDYYEILELGEDASVEDIRISFRRLSRVHHPDKNLDDQEGATKRFAKVNVAYEILSDAESRAEYDYTRKQKRSASRSEPSGYAGNYRAEPSASRSGWFSSFGARPAAHGNDGCPGCVFRAQWGIAPQHLQLFSLPGIYSGVHDGEQGFFTLYRFVFEFIAKDECTFARRTPSSFPSFGDSSWPFQGPFVKVPKRNKKKRGPVRKDDVKSFYDFWTTFSSEKSFAYAKPFELDGVPHSSTKRWFEKENKRLEGMARTEYNQTVRDLANHVRRLDPRCH